MSAGAFTLTKYGTENGDTIPIKLQPETLQATFDGSINGAPTNDITDGFPSALVSKSRRAIGIHPRVITVRITAGLPTGYKLPGTYRIPVLSKTVYDGANKGDAAGYLGGTGVIVSKSPEVIV